MSRRTTASRLACSPRSSARPSRWCSTISTSPRPPTFLADQGLRQLAPDLVLALLRVTGGNPLFLRRIAALGAPDPQRALARGPAGRHRPGAGGALACNPAGAAGQRRARTDTGGVRGGRRVGDRSPRSARRGGRGDRRGTGHLAACGCARSLRLHARAGAHGAGGRTGAGRAPRRPCPGRPDRGRGGPGNDCACRRSDRSPGPTGASRAGGGPTVDGRRANGRERLPGRRPRPC